jgi:hypothetical protein
MIYFMFIIINTLNFIKKITFIISYINKYNINKKYKNLIIFIFSIYTNSIFHCSIHRTERS